MLSVLIADVLSVKQATTEQQVIVGSLGLMVLIWRCPSTLAVIISLGQLCRLSSSAHRQPNCTRRMILLKLYRFAEIRHCDSNHPFIIKTDIWLSVTVDDAGNLSDGQLSKRCEITYKITPYITYIWH